VSGHTLRTEGSQTDRVRKFQRGAAIWPRARDQREQFLRPLLAKLIAGLGGERH
jgi:hypothetical protein